MCKFSTISIFNVNFLYLLRVRLNILYDLVELELTSSNKDQGLYRLLLVIGSLAPLETNILLILSHLSPKRLTATQLTQLLGYSKNSRVIYRGVLDKLALDEFITLEKVTTKKFSIQLNISHPLMNMLTELSFDYGDDYSNNLQDILGDYYE